MSEAHPTMNGRGGMPVPVMSGGVGIAVALCLLACDDRSAIDSTRHWDGTIRDSAGITLVSNHGMPLWGEGDGWTFVPVLRIGERDGDTLSQFGSITGAARLSDGTIAVADAFAHSVRFYAPDGTFLSSLGRKGAGPEEFAGSVNLVVGPNDTLLAIDWGQARASRIRADGTWHGSFSHVPQDGFYSAFWDDDVTTGRLASLLHPFFSDGEFLGGDSALVVLRDLDGAVRDTIARFPREEFSSWSEAGTVLHYFRGVGEFDLCNGSAVVGHTADFTLRWHRMDGTVERIMTLDRAPMPMTDADRRVLVESLDQLARERGMSAAQLSSRKSRMWFEDTYPAWREMLCGPAGTVLVQRVRPLRDLIDATDAELRGIRRGGRPPGGEWDVFDEAGRYLGVTELPAEPGQNAFTRDAAGRWLMMGVGRDELDTPYIGVWRVDGFQPDQP